MSKTIVLTGASDGIGAATAVRLAETGINLLLTARDSTDLHDVADTCRRLGATVSTITADVSSIEEIVKVRAQAIEEFEQIDAWINIAGIAQVGNFVDVPPDNFERVVNVNFFGIVNGSREALKQFEEQKYGTLVNISSVLGATAAPYESAYVSSKFAVRGFTASIRQEYQARYPDIHICCVLPSSSGTAIYEKASNYSGKVVRLLPPVYKPDLIARKIQHLLLYPEGEVLAGGGGALLITVSRWFPRTTALLFSGYVRLVHFKSETAAITTGNLHHHYKPRSKNDPFALPNWFDSFLLALAIVCVGKYYSRRKARHD